VATLEKVRSFLDDVKKRVAIVKVAVHGSDAAFTVRVGTETFRPGEERVMAPGHVHVSILEGTVEKVGQDVDLLPGETKSVEVTIPAPPPPRPIEPLPPVRPAPVTKRPESSLGYYVSGGIIGGLGLVSIGIGAVFYTKAKSDHDELESVCGANGKSCPADKNQQIQDGKDEQAASIIAWVAGGAGASLGLGLIIAGLTQSSHAGREASTEQNVSFSVGPTWVGVTTRF